MLNRKSPKKLKRIPELTYEIYFTFPLKDGTTVPWKKAQKAYQYYVAMYGTLLSLEELARRGGFTKKEFREWSRGVDLDGTKIELENAYGTGNS